MKKRTLGKSNLEVSAIGLGCMGLNFSYDHSLSKEESITLIRQAVDRGGKDLQRVGVSAQRKDNYHQVRYLMMNLLCLQRDRGNLRRALRPHGRRAGWITTGNQHGGDSGSQKNNLGGGRTGIHRGLLVR